MTSFNYFMPDGTELSQIGGLPNVKGYRRTLLSSGVVLHSPKTGRYLVDAPPTGFKTAPKFSQATIFKTIGAAVEFINSRGIIWEVQMIMLGGAK